MISAVFQMLEIIHKLALVPVNQNIVGKKLLTSLS